MTKREMIDEIIEHDLDSIGECGWERCVKEMLDIGSQGYSKMTDKEIEDTYSDIFEESK